MASPAVLRNRDFDLYWAGVVLSQIGTRGTVAANLYQVYELTGSVAHTGLVGAGAGRRAAGAEPAGRGATPTGWTVAGCCRWLRRSRWWSRSCSPSLTFTGDVEAWHVVVSALLTTAAATFDQPARQALIPALVPRAAAAAGHRPAQPLA